MKKSIERIVCGMLSVGAASSMLQASPVLAQEEMPVHETAGTQAMQPALQSITLDGQPTDNRYSDYTWNYGMVIQSVLAQTEEGYERIEYFGSNVLVESYSNDHRLLRTKEIPLSLPIFGGAYAGTDYNYIVCGQTNEDENNNLAVLHVEQYSKDWNLVRRTPISNINTVIPFDAGSLAMTEANGKLYIHTCHEMYRSDDGYNHQANMAFRLDARSLELEQSNTGVSNLSTGYASHSFMQYCAADDTSLFRVDHGDAYPRGVSIVKTPLNGSITDAEYAIALPISGEIGDNRTGVEVTGMALSDNNVLIVGTSADQGVPHPSEGGYDVWLSVTDKNLQSSKTVWLTQLSQTTDPYNTRIVPTGEGEFLVMWIELDYTGSVMVTRAVLVNEDGEKTSKVFTISPEASAARPVLFSDGTIRWYTTDSYTTKLHILNPASMKEGNKQPVEMYRLYNPNSGEHFYTQQAHERDYLKSVGWNDEGIGWIAPDLAEDPVYRLYNRNAGDHHYTLSEKERDFLINEGWEYEGIGWYSAGESGVPLYRQYNPNAKAAGSHNYTTDTNEKNFLISAGWNDEQIGWYGLSQ